MYAQKDFLYRKSRKTKVIIDNPEDIQNPKKHHTRFTRIVFNVFWF